ncbi:MAG: hypothetical protein EOO36_00165 [Cytophagaceae bacterium]|nr:MAG: hypothetical protein EOO36_00165 [Cytophagaceae bacterium]
MVLALLAGPALAQQHTLPAAPAAGLPTGEQYQLGHTYRVETVQGTKFSGRLVSMSLTKLEFDTPELGTFSLERAQIRRADLQGPATIAAAATKPGYFDIGNGNRLFFAPTARGLRQGEATLQDVDVYFVGLNYGLTRNISVGGYVSLVPGLAPNEQLLVLTPKVSFPISEKLHVGAGLLYARVPSFDSNGRATGVGLGYGVVTYGSADNNLTFGLGYGFVNGDIGSTPVLQLGGQTRVSRRVSLISENYILADSRAGMGGLYGIKINWRRTSLGLGAAYFYGFGYDTTESYSYNSNGQLVTTTQTYHNGGEGFTTYILPIYYDFTFRFGKGTR